MARKKITLEQMAAQAIRLGADHLEIEYKDGCEEVFAMKSGFGWGIASIRSSNPEAKSLRSELYALAKKKQRVEIDEHTPTSCAPVSLTVSARMPFAWSCALCDNRTAVCEEQPAFSKPG